MNRRSYLVSCAVGVAVVAGCAGPEGDDSDEEETPQTASPTPTESEPDIEMVSTAPGKQAYYFWEDVQIDSEFENHGATGTVDLQVAVEGETLVEKTVRVVDERHVESVRISGVTPGEYVYAVTAGGDTLEGTFTVVSPVDRPMTVPSYSILEREDYSDTNADRINFDVEVRADPERGVAPPGRRGLLNICRKVVYEELSEQRWDAIGFNIWRQPQTVGAEAAHATIAWGPNGSWSDAGGGESVDYSEHEFAVDGSQYLVTRGVEDVRTDGRDFRVEFEIVNQGVVPGQLTGAVSTPQTDEVEFDIDLEPGESTQVWYEAEYDGEQDSTYYNIDVYGFSELYGRTSASIDFTDSTDRRNSS